MRINIMHDNHRKKPSRKSYKNDKASQCILTGKIKIAKLLLLLLLLLQLIKKKGKTIQTKQDFPKQRKKILSTTGNK